MHVGTWTAHKDLRVFESVLPVKPVGFRRYVGLDFGESCGLAFCDLRPNQPVVEAKMYLDLLDLSIGTFDSSAIRFLRLDAFLEILAPDVLGFEDVKYTPSADLLIGKASPAAILARSARPTEFFGGLKYYVQTWAEQRSIPAKGWGIGEIKKHATGKGNASKAQMIEACNKLLGTTFDPKDEKSGADDMCDAAFALCMTVEHYRAA